MDSWGNFWIFFLYFIGLVIWVFLLWVLGLWINDILSLFFALIPPFVFFVALCSLRKPKNHENENWIFRNNYANAVVIVIFPILIWAASRTPVNRQLLLVVLVATGFSLLTFYDLWVDDTCFDYSKHFRTICQAISITLALFALKLFYCDRVGFSVTEEETTLAMLAASEVR